MPNIVVVGAGVSGLTTALLLSRNPDNKVTIVSKHMPGDYDIEYTSPWAGANYLPVSTAEGSKYERVTWPVLAHLAKNVPEAGVHFQTAVCYGRKKDESSVTGRWFAELIRPDAWYKSVVPDFKILPASELPPGVQTGISFTSVCMNTAIYLPYLVSQCLKQGCVLSRATLEHISDAAALHHSKEKADVVVNCTGILASKLGGVMDSSVIPARGQILVVRNTAPAMVSISGTDDASDEVCYMMTRAAGGGTIIGGTYQKGNWDGKPDQATAERIMKRAVQICPALTNGKSWEHLDVVRHGVGLRPLREAGCRIEKEKIRDVWVVHNYGHGGWGYQASYGCAEETADLVEEVLKPSARL